LDGTFGATARSSQARIKSAQFGAALRLPPGRCGIEASAICFAIETGKLNGVSEFGFGFNSKTAISMCLRGFARMAGIGLGSLLSGVIPAGRHVGLANVEGVCWRCSPK